MVDNPYDPSSYLSGAVNHDFAMALSRQNVAAALTSGLLVPGQHNVDDAITMYREVLAKLLVDDD